MITVCRILFIIVAIIPHYAFATEELKHPAIINIPDKILSCEEIVHWKTDEEIVIFPTSIYTKSHYDGWQACLVQFSSTSIPPERLQMSSIALSVYEKYTEKGLNDGFYSCKKLIIKQASKINKTEGNKINLRKEAKNAIRIRENQPSYGFRHRASKYPPSK